MSGQMLDTVGSGAPFPARGRKSTGAAFVELVGQDGSNALAAITGDDSAGNALPTNLAMTGVVTTGTTVVMSASGTLNGVAKNYSKTITGVGTGSVTIGKWTVVQ